jgi:ADP-ribose pyrophosphatase
VLVRQYRSAIDGYTLECPAGKVGDGVAGESPLQAIGRELLEEAGYRLETARQLGKLLTAPHFADETIHVFSTRGRIVTEPQPTTHEQLTVELVPPQHINDLIRSGTLTDAKSLAALLLHREMKVSW